MQFSLEEKSGGLICGFVAPFNWCRCGGTVARKEKSGGLICGKPRAAIRRCCSGSVYGGGKVVSVPAYGS
ncbi:hypothetical protein NC652_037775 [Populus alba x Populus x berolinensis]|nr:hypothetical protein NC652_037775 [Populus alba x Populus x berolinensis]